MLSFFDHSTVMAQPWADAGYLSYCIDTQHPRGETHDERNENIILVGADLHNWLPPQEGKIVFASFFLPATDLAGSGARAFHEKGISKLIDTLSLFTRSVELAESLKCPYFIENSVSTISSYWRPPDHAFDPCDYGDLYSKKSHLWVGGGFVMPTKESVRPIEASLERTNPRGFMPAGFAKAVFKANAPRQRTTGQAPQPNVRDYPSKVAASLEANCGCEVNETLPTVE
jgi:hypothetical protein